MATVNSATRNARAGLWEKAQELPPASDGDFFGSNRRPPEVDPEYLKIINDTSLRTRLIDSGIAEGLQSPKGPQKIPSIIRLYPNFDAPGKDAAARNGRSTPAARTAFGLPTVEELDALLARIHAIEAEVSAELQQRVNADISRLKREIGELEGDEFEHAFHALERALGARKALAGQIREEAFRRIDSEAAFAPRKYLRLIAREPRG
jgi:hypothetical protein